MRHGEGQYGEPAAPEADWWLQSLASKRCLAFSIPHCAYLHVRLSACARRANQDRDCTAEDFQPWTRNIDKDYDREPWYRNMDICIKMALSKLEYIMREHLKYLSNKVCIQLPPPPSLFFLQSGRVPMPAVCMWLRAYSRDEWQFPSCEQPPPPPPPTPPHPLHPDHTFTHGPEYSVKQAGAQSAGCQPGEMTAAPRGGGGAWYERGLVLCDCGRGGEQACCGGAEVRSQGISLLSVSAGGKHGDAQEHTCNRSWRAWVWQCVAARMVLGSSEYS